MSLAMYAAPFNNDNNDSYNSNINDTLINRKRTSQSHNKTQKRTEKVNAVLESLHNNVSDDSNLGDFKPLSPPTSMGVENTKIRESFNNNNNNDHNNSSNDNDNISPLENDNVNLSMLKNNYMNDKAVEKYYQNLIPNYKQSSYAAPSEVNKMYYPSQPTHIPTYYEHTMPIPENNILLDKLNYMINLLEEQQDQKTNNVTEEVVLYSFLGIFIIFIVDSFAKVGKYVR